MGCGHVEMVDEEAFGLSAKMNQRFCWREGRTVLVDDVEFEVKVAKSPLRLA